MSHALAPDAYDPEVHVVAAEWTAIVLAGGRGSRLGSDKAQARLGERRLVDRVLGGLPGSVPVIVVGPDPGPLGRAALVVRESPPFTGPAAALAAALPHVSTPLVGLLAVDMPFAAPALARLVEALVDGPTDAVGAVAVDDTGQRQWLCASYRVATIRAALDGLDVIAGASVRQLLDGQRLVQIPVSATQGLDVDTPADLERAHAQLGEHVLSLESQDGSGNAEPEHGQG